MGTGQGFHYVLKIVLATGKEGGKVEEGSRNLTGDSFCPSILKQLLCPFPEVHSVCLGSDDLSMLFDAVTEKAGQCDF